VLFTKYYSGDKIEKNEMGGACSTYGGRSTYRVLLGKWKVTTWKTMCRWEYNIKMDIQEVGLMGGGLD
jgi:hypothetical protein